MIFNSIDFLAFFVIVFALFYSLSGKPRQILLFTASCVFYMWFIPVYVLILFLTILIDYVAAIKIEEHDSQKSKKLHLILGVVNTCIVLFVFKYHNFFIDNFNYLGLHTISRWDIILPIGLSFHVFQSLSYVIEVYRGNIKAERNLLVYANFVMMFPQLVAGPIERADNLIPQLRDDAKPISYDDFYIGFHRFIWGLFKKVVVADLLSTYVDATYNNYEIHPGSMLLVGTICFSIQIYCDFSGYSDMAIGIARMLGFKFRENFLIPYFSKDITEFWRRWHISLSTWLRDYLYISFGGNRHGKFNTYRNLMLTFLLGGLWHGASWNFVIWGALNGLYLSIEKATDLPKYKPKHILAKLFRISYVFVLISFSWIFFRSITFQQAITIIRKIIFNFNIRGFKFLDTNVFASMMLGTVILLVVEYFIFRKYSFESIIKKKAPRLVWVFCLFMLFTIVLLGNSNGSQFIYFQF